MAAFQLCHINDIQDNAAKSFIVETGSRRIELFVVRCNEQYFAYHNHCPHTGVNLNWQADQFLDYFNEYIQCAFHGALFDIQTGYCVRGPCMGQYLLNIPLNIDSQLIYVSLE